ncbi:hypothetical protein GCM10007893_26580 [Paracoccus marinus]|nr:hypothetical protein GCM10007893_26580 [Paracoccus marinus]
MISTLSRKPPSQMFDLINQTFSHRDGKNVLLSGAFLAVFY